MPRTNRRALSFVVPSMAMIAMLGAKAEAQSDKPKVEDGVAAYIGDKPVTIAELDAKALGEDLKLAQSLYDARRKALNDIIMEQVLAEEAKAQGTTSDALLRQRLAEETKPVTDEDVEAFYNANRNRMRGQSLEAMSGRIRQYLASQETTQARERLLKKLKQKADVRIALEAPRATVKVASNEPAVGPDNADITIVEYVDFQ